MKVSAIYIDKSYFADKLGIKENQFVFGEITGNQHEIEFKLFIDDNADVESASELSSNNWTIARQKFE